MGAVSGALVSWLLTDAATAAAQHLDANRDAIEKDAGVVSIAHIHGLGKSPEEAAARLAGLWWGTVTPTTTREAAFAAHFEPVRAAQACIVADISNASGPFAPPPSIDDASASTMLPVADVAKVTGLDEDALIAGACRVVDGLRTAADDGRVLKTAYEGLDLAAGAIAARLGLLALGPAPAVSDMERRYAAHLQPARDLRRAVAAALRSQLARSEAAAGGGTAAPSGAAAAGAASAGASSARYGVTPASLHSTSAPLPATRAATGGAAAAPSTPATNSSRSADAAIVRPGSLGAASGEFMTVNIVLLGDSAAGKTSIIRRLVRNEYDLTLVATIGTEFRPWLVTIRGAPVKCLVRDSAGAERFRIYSLSYLRGALAVVLVYDVQCAASFRGIPNWIHSVQEHEGLHPNALCALIGAKADTDYRQVRLRGYMTERGVANSLVKVRTPACACCCCRSVRQKVKHWQTSTASSSLKSVPQPAPV